MLRQASVSDLISERVSRDHGYVVITMRRYPRFVNRALRDEYLSCLSPDRKLFENWISTKRRYKDHNGAFQKVRFEERFKIDAEGMEALARLVRLSSKKDVFLVCQCHIGNRCHREMVLILAKKLFKGSKVERPKNQYPQFVDRIKEFKAQYKTTLQDSTRQTRSKRDVDDAGDKTSRRQTRSQ